MPTRDKYVEALRKAAEGGNNEVANEFAEIITFMDQNGLQEYEPPSASQPAPEKTGVERAQDNRRRVLENRQRSKPNSGLGAFGAGVGRIADVAGTAASGDFTEAAIKGVPVVQDAATGALNALQATGRGILDLGGDLDDFAIAGLTAGSGGTFADRVQQSKAQRDELAKSNPLATFTGQAIGFGKAGSALRGALPARLGTGATAVAAEGALIGGANTAAENITDVATGEKSLADAAKETGLVTLAGGVIGGTADKLLRPITNSIGAAAGALTGTAPGPLPAKTARAASNRIEDSPEQILKAQAEFKEANQVTPALIDILDDTKRLQRLSAAREGAGDVFTAAEESSLRALPAEFRASVNALGDSTTPNEALADLTGAARTKAREIQGLGNQELRNIADGKLGQMRDIATAVRENVIEKDRAIKIAKAELVKRTDIDKEINQWATETMRISGLADNLVTIGPDEFRETIPPEKFVDSLKTIASSLGDEQRGILREAAEAVVGGEPANLTLSDVDILRRAFRDVAQKNPELHNLTLAADKIEDLAIESVPQYGDFLSKFSALKRAGTEYGEFARSHGADPSVLRLADQIILSADEVVSSIGEPGKAVIANMRAIMKRIEDNSKALEDIKVRGQDAGDTVASNARLSAEEIRSQTGQDLQELSQLLKDNSNAVKVAGNVLRERTDNFLSTIAKAEEGVPLGRVALGGIQDAASSERGALGAVRALNETETARRLEGVVGEETAGRLVDIGRTREQALLNRNDVANAAGRNSQRERVGRDALDVGIVLTGRPGPGYTLSTIRRVLSTVQQLGLNDREIDRLATAFTTGDDAVLRQIAEQVGRTQAQKESVRRVVNAAILAKTTEASRDAAQ